MVEQNIIFLGSGGGRIVVANQLAATGGFVIQLNGHQIFVDPGPGALVRARQYKVKANKTDIIFVSHNHLDHVNDLNALIYSMTLDGVYKKGILISTPTVITGEGAEGNVPWLQPTYKKQLQEYFAINPGDNIKIDNLNFIATPTNHDAKHNIGFKLETSNMTIGYTSDTTKFPELAEVYKGCDILILNVLRPNKDRWKTHLCSEDVVEILNKVRPELAIIQHYGAKIIRARPIFEAREIQRRTGIRTIAAMDGTRVDIRGLDLEKKNKPELQNA